MGVGRNSEAYCAGRACGLLADYAALIRPTGYVDETAVKLDHKTKQVGPIKRWV